MKTLIFVVITIFWCLVSLAFALRVLEIHSIFDRLLPAYVHTWHLALAAVIAFVLSKGLEEHDVTSMDLRKHVTFE
jgi:hypothetical protein